MRAALPRRLRRTTTAGLVALAAGLAGCAEVSLIGHTAKQAAAPRPPAQADGARPQGAYKLGNPYQVHGTWYYPKDDPFYDETGIASWYGAEFGGKPTANGETFDPNDVTAAHRTLPMPTFVRVTNVENGRSILVRVNDRGPFARGRIIDLSRRSAQLLGFDRQGTARVRVQVAGPASGDGDFAQPWPNWSDIQLARAATTPSQPPPPAPPQVAQVGDNGVVLDGAGLRVEAARPGALYIQAGAFSQRENADRLSRQLARFGRTRVAHTSIRGTDYYRVQVGPLGSVDQADRTLERVIGAGYPDARIVVD
jgi:rare lipoprotein A